MINTSPGVAFLSFAFRLPLPVKYNAAPRWIRLQGTSQRIAEVPSQNTFMCVYTSSSFSFVMRKTCAHPLDSLVWAAMTATPQKHTRTWLLNLFKEQLPCRVIFKIKFLASSSEKERERDGVGEKEGAGYAILFINFCALCP